MTIVSARPGPSSRASSDRDRETTAIGGVSARPRRRRKVDVDLGRLDRAVALDACSAGADQDESQSERCKPNTRRSPGLDSEAEAPSGPCAEPSTELMKIARTQGSVAVLGESVQLGKIVVG